MSEENFPVPSAPGRATADEYLGMLAPSINAMTTTVTAQPDADTVVMPIKSRKTIILQAKGAVWVGIGRAATPNETLLLPAGAVTGVDIMSNVTVNLRAEGAAPANVLVIQLGQAL